MNNFLVKAAILAAVGAVTPAFALTTIDFELMTSNTLMPSYTEADVIFTPVGGPAIKGVYAPNGTIGLLGGDDPQSEIRADIAVEANYVSVDLGDWGYDSDTLFLEVFDAGDVLLGYTQLLIDAEFIGMKTLEVTANGSIAYAVFGARFPAEGGSSVVADNFTYGMTGVIENSPPFVQPSPESQTVEIGIDDIIIIATVSDYDGDTLSYQWLKDGEILVSGSAEAIEGGELVPLPALIFAAGDPRFDVGTHAIVLSVSDGHNAPVVMQVTVIVQDTMNPIIQPVPSVTMLWPPNHELRDVEVQANACDNSGGSVALAVNVVSSEPPDADADGNTIPDFYIDAVDSLTGLIQLRLRAERSGTGEGRTYTITITATDVQGHSSSAALGILAPHDRRKAK